MPWAISGATGRAGRTGRRCHATSPRRAAQLLKCYPDLKIVPLRGNIQTRLDYNYNSGVSSSKADKEYVAIRQVKVTVRDLDKLNTLLDGALSSGLNEIRDITLGVAKDEAFRAEARKKAVDSAVTQAKDLAKDFGVTLGPVFSIRYRAPSSSPAPIP